MAKKITAILGTAALLLSLTACANTGEVRQGDEQGSEGESVKPVITDTPTEQPTEPSGIRLNTELLSELTMTLSELEEKHGKIVDTTINNSGDHTYFFERGNNICYGFTEWDGHNRAGEHRSLDWMGVQVRDLFLGTENAIADYDVEKVIGLKIDMEPLFPEQSTLLLSDYSVASGFYFTIFWHGGHYLMRIAHTKEGVIEPDSWVTVAYHENIW